MLQILKLSLLILFCFCLSDISAQEDSNYYLVYTTNGSKFKGQILERDDEKLILLSEDIGKITINTKDIKLLKEVESKLAFNNQSLETKNFWGPTAFGAKKKHSYYQNIAGLFNELNYSLANNFSIGLGAVPILLGYQPSWPIWIMPKYSFPSKKENIHFAIGGIAGQIIGSEKDPNLALAFGLMTLGNRKRNFTLGLAYGKYDGSIKKIPITNLSGNFHVIGPFSIVTENYILFNSDNELYSYSLVGAKFAWQRIGLDCGIVVPRNTGNPIAPFPFIGIAVPLGKG